jgi:hypothetical protein
MLDTMLLLVILWQGGTQWQIQLNMTGWSNKGISHRKNSYFIFFLFCIQACGDLRVVYGTQYLPLDPPLEARHNLVVCCSFEFSFYLQSLLINVHKL